MSSKPMKRTERMGMKGIHTITIASISEPEAKLMHDELRELDLTLQRIREKEGSRTHKYRTLASIFCENLRLFNARFGYRKFVVKNVTCDDGRTRIAKALSGNTATVDEMEVNYVSVGTSATAPATGDTQLTAETFRKAVSSVTYSGKNFYATGFYAAGEATTTINEHGLFIEGSGTANSGELLSHLLTGAVVKGAGDTLTVETEIQINDA